MGSIKYTLNETVCPQCGRLFYPKPDHVYKERYKKKLYSFCRYTCLTKFRRENKILK